MDLSRYSNRELVKELTSRKGFLGCVLHYSRPLGSSAQDASKATIVVSNQMGNGKALLLLKAAVRAMERGAAVSESRPKDAKSSTSVQASEQAMSSLVDPNKFVSLRADSD